MKKVVDLLLLTVTVCGVMVFSSCEDENMDYEFSALNANGMKIYYNVLNSSEVEVTHNFNVADASNRYQGNIVIPKEVQIGRKQMKVTRIGERAFYGCDQLTGITIPSTTISIEDRAFAGCNKFTSVVIPNSVVTINSNAFYECI